MSVTYSINKNPLFVQIQAVGGAPHFTETLLCPEFLSLVIILLFDCWSKFMWFSLFLGIGTIQSRAAEKADRIVSE